MVSEVGEFERLAELRDQALHESHAYGHRYHLGMLSLGSEVALWTTGNTTTQLLDQGVRWGENLITPNRSTVNVIEHDPVDPNRAGFVTQFLLDLECGLIEARVGFNNVPRAIPDSLSQLQTRRLKQQYDFTSATEEQEKILYTELEKGASGLFRLIG